jgi:hypothetical protein
MFVVASLGVEKLAGLLLHMVLTVLQQFQWQKRSSTLFEAVD